MSDYVFNAEYRADQHCGYCDQKSPYANICGDCRNLEKMEAKFDKEREELLAKIKDLETKLQRQVVQHLSQMGQCMEEHHWKGNCPTDVPEGMKQVQPGVYVEKASTSIFSRIMPRVKEREMCCDVCGGYFPANQMVLVPAIGYMCKKKKGCKPRAFTKNPADDLILVMENEEQRVATDEEMAEWRREGEEMRKEVAKRIKPMTQGPFNPPEKVYIPADSTMGRIRSEVWNEALDAAVEAMNPLLRSMLSRGEAVRILKGLKK